jgi:signal transduction histidine kinase
MSARRGLGIRLIIAAAAIAATLSAALGALVVLPVNGLIDDGHVRATVREADLARTAVLAGAVPPGIRLLTTAPGPRDAPVVAADWARARDPNYVRTVRAGHVVVAIRSTGDGRLLVVRDDRGGAIEARERLGLVLALVLVLAGTMGWALWAGGAYARRVARLAAVAGRIADGDFSARAEIRGSDELARLGADIDRMAARLGALERARAEFVAKVSHDLRTPLTIIKGYAYTLARREADPEAARRLAAISRESDRLTALVDDLLTLSQAGAGALRVTPGPVDLGALLAEVEERMRPLAAERGIRLRSANADAVIVGDRRRLVQVLTNLTANAVRHTPPGGEVDVSAAVDLGGARISVADTGPGIDPGEVDRLLRPFEHGGGPASGSGLGLAIARELTAAHGGHLELARREGGGTIATVALPLGAGR